jgi:hypothetical protein
MNNIDETTIRLDLHAAKDWRTTELKTLLENALQHCAARDAYLEPHTRCYAGLAEIEKLILRAFRMV